MKSIVFAAISAAVFAAHATEVFRLELTDGQPFIVGVDNVRRPVVLVDPEDWAAVTNNVFREIARLNATENGRIRLHGNRKQQIVNDKDHEKVSVYEDGFVFVEKMTASRPFVEKRKSKADESAKRSLYSKKYVEMLEARAERAKGKAKTVTVEHDAATGKDIVK